MIEELEHRVRERAHGIWEREGRPVGQAEAHWALALAEIAREAPAKARAARKPAAAPKPRAAAKAPKAR